MNINSSTTETTTTEGACYSASYATLYSKGLVRLAEVSRLSIAVAVEQNVELLASCRKALNAPSDPGLFLFDWAGQAFESCVVLQRNLLHLMVEQSTAAINVNRGMTGAIQQSAELSLAVAEPNRDSPQEQSVNDIMKQDYFDVDDTHGETFEDIVQLRADSLLAKEIVDLAVMQPPGVVGAEDIIQLKVDKKKQEIVDLTRSLKITDIN